jgi:HK97 gp10 family phage protein
MAIFPAARLIRDRARANAPLGKGYTKGGELRHLKTSIFAAYGKPDAYDVIAGVDLKKVPHAHLVEFGTQAHSLHKGARIKSGRLQSIGPFHPGSKKHPFFIPAIKSSRGAVVKLIRDGLTKLIEVKLEIFKTGKPVSE